MCPVKLPVLVPHVPGFQLVKRQSIVNGVIIAEE